MIRNLKVLLAAALALAAFGAFSASSAQAAHEFHCSVNPCTLKARQDGTGATAHQVFIVHNTKTGGSVSFTCHGIVGEGTTGLTATSITTTNVKYETCTVNGAPGVTVDMNGCNYKFFGGTAGTTDAAGINVECPEGKKIQVTIPELGCTFEIGSQNLTGVGYQTQNVPPIREVTLTAKNVQNIAVTANAGCAFLIDPSGPLVGTYTTGNVVATGQTGAGVMAEAWFL